MREREAITSAVRRLEELGLGIRARVHFARQEPGRNADCWLTVEMGASQHKFAVEAKRGPTPSTLGAIVAQLKETHRATGHPSLLISDYVSPPVAERLRKQEQLFLDAAGNCFLRGEGLLVFVTGRKPAAELMVLRGAHAFSPSGLKLLFALIADPELAAAPQRSIAAAAGVALGTVPKALSDLRESGRLLESSRTRRLTPHRRLLDDWAMGFAQQIRPKTLRAAYSTPAIANWKRWELDYSKLLWGAEPAAHLLVGHLRPGQLTLWGHDIPPRLKMDLRLTLTSPHDSNQPLELRRPFWGESLAHGGRQDTVAPALVYAELLAVGDARCMETAEMVHERYLARLFPGG